MNFIDGFREFMIKYNVIGLMVGFAFAVATIGFIKSFVSDLLIPTIYLIIGKFILQYINTTVFDKFTHLFGSSINIDNFVKEFFTWILILLSTYIIIKYFIIREILGEKTVDNKNKILPSPTTPATSPNVSKQEFNTKQEKYHLEQFYM
jgi:large-conductance mechanosensitive channel